MLRTCNVNYRHLPNLYDLNQPKDPIPSTTKVGAKRKPPHNSIEYLSTTVIIKNKKFLHTTEVVSTSVHVSYVPMVRNHTGPSQTHPRSSADLQPQSPITSTSKVVPKPKPLKTNPKLLSKTSISMKENILTTSVSNSTSLPGSNDHAPLLRNHNAPPSNIQKASDVIQPQPLVESTSKVVTKRKPLNTNVDYLSSTSKCKTKTVNVPTQQSHGASEPLSHFTSSRLENNVDAHVQCTPNSWSEHFQHSRSSNF